MTLLSPERILSGFDHFTHPIRHKSKAAQGGVLVPVDGSRTSMRGVSLATVLTPSITSEDKPIRPLYIVTPARRLPLDADLVQEAQIGEDILGEAEQIAKQENKETHGELLQARSAKEAIIDEMKEMQASVVVMATKGDPTSETGLGKTVEHVLREAVNQTIIVDRAPLENPPNHPATRRVKVERLGRKQSNRFRTLVHLLTFGRLR